MYQAVRLKLAKEEAANMERDKGKRKLRSTVAKKPVPASVFLIVGLDLEEQQCVTNPYI